MTRAGAARAMASGSPARSAARARRSRPGSEGRSPTPEARRAFARPDAAAPAGRWLARHGAHAMLDLSDGLGADAAHLAAASGVALALEPRARSGRGAGGRRQRRRLGMPPEQFAAESGEDYELLVALPADVRGRRRASPSRARPGCRSRASARCGPVPACTPTLGGKPVALAGFDHFAPRRR